MRGRSKRKPPPLRADTALFLDVDGTLIDIAPTPDAVVIPDDLIETLRRLNRALGGAVALVSGRRRAELRRFFRGAGVIQIAEHGAAASVPLAGLTRRRQRMPSALVAALRQFAARHPGALAEVKSHGVALHVRRAPAAAVQARRIALALAAKHARHVRLIRGKAVFEFALVGISKGHAVEALLRRPPFRGRIPYMIGDDVTDEDGFAAANRRRGTSVRVGGKRMPTAARFAIASPAEMRRWLRLSADTLLGEATARTGRARQP